MIQKLSQLRTLVEGLPVRTVAVACAHDEHTLEAVLKAAEQGILRYILIGHREEILAIGESLGYTISTDAVIDAETDAQAAEIAVRLVREGKADFIQKGFLQSATLLKAVVNKETGIGLGRPMSHIALFEIPGYHKLVGLTDGGMIPQPDLETKKAIVTSAVEVFHRLGYEKPVVAAMCPAENVSPKIQETVDAATLRELSLTGKLGSCYVEGPISLDLALSGQSAQNKGYTSPAAGETDILLVPNITAGNMGIKLLTTFCGGKMAGLILGAQCPIALNSRTTSFEEKYNSLLACILISGS